MKQSNNKKPNPSGTGELAQRLRAHIVIVRTGVQFLASILGCLQLPLTAMASEDIVLIQNSKTMVPQSPAQEKVKTQNTEVNFEPHTYCFHTIVKSKTETKLQEVGSCLYIS